MLPCDIVQVNVVMMLKTKNIIIIMQFFKQIFSAYEISVYFPKLLEFERCKLKGNHLSLRFMIFLW